MEIRKISRRRPRSVDEAELGHLTLTVKKCTKIYNTRAQLLFCLFGNVLVAVVVVVCLNDDSTFLYRNQRQLSVSFDTSL